MADINILINGDMAEPFTEIPSDEGLVCPNGWGPWWMPRPEKSTVPEWQYVKPVFNHQFLDGRLVPSVSSPYATFVGGYYQQIPAVAGERYEIEVDVQGWSSEAEKSGEIRDGSDLNVQVGVDPTGGLDGQSPVIEWSRLQQPLGRWETVRLLFTAQGSIITLFLKAAPHLPKRQQAIFWRNAVLRPVGRYKRATQIVGLGDTHLILEPERPDPGQDLLITASSRLQPRQPAFWIFKEGRLLESGEIEGSDQRDDRYRWRYRLPIDEEGLYDIRLVGEQGARLYAQKLLRVAREVQIVPSGDARTDYTRIYVLLPPTADEQWASAAARGGFLGRFTIGFSADDAGLGDIQERQVIAVNPHHWEETLTSAWYDHYYPGTRFIPVVANSPADLEAWLRDYLFEMS